MGWLRDDRDRDRGVARRVLKLLQDGRPPGCTCPPNPGMNALPCDNAHVGSTSCPLTPLGNTDSRRPAIDTNRGVEYVKPHGRR